MRYYILRQPALAPFVVFDVSVTFLFADFCQTQVKFFHIGIFFDLFHRVIQNDSAVFHDIAVIGDAQRQAGILFNQENTNPFFLIDSPDNFKNFGHQQGRKAHGWLIHQYEPG